jgi:hypothetical protein
LGTQLQISERPQEWEYGLYSVLVRTDKYQVGDELKEEPHFTYNSLMEIVDAIDVEYPRFFLSATRTFNPKNVS